MKRVLAMVLVLMLCVASSGALAAGKLSVVQENYYTIDSYSAYGYLFAKVQNIGDKPITVNAGLLEIYDENGDPLTSTDYVNTYMTYLEPEQYTYVSAYEDIEAGAAAVDDYMFTISGKSDNDYSVIQLPCEGEFLADVDAGYTTYDYMVATVTNDTGVPVYDIEIVLALLDADGNILYIDSDAMYSTKALNADSSMTVRKDVNSAFKEYYEAEGMVPTQVDALAYALVRTY